MQRKVAVTIGDQGDSENMWSFLRDTLKFDGLVTGDCKSVASVKATLRTVL